ncbi:SIMPL domain-containing protein [Zooshikella sp. RANM57]|uniref:SIMPL domain-containing protein n=1 Tax=Zooshikella sp. RANM57 TaxID=3425863 RepID=UPI003D6E5F28
MNYASQFFLISFTFFVASFAYGGFSSSKGYNTYDMYKHNFQYKIEGEIEVKPDVAYLPVTIKTTDKSYTTALSQSKTVLDKLVEELNALNEPSFSISSTDFFKPKKYAKKIDISFFNKSEDVVNSNLNVYLAIDFTDSDTFWVKAEKIAIALDFVQKFSKKYDAYDNIIVASKDIYYEVKDKEQYREKIVKRVYEKAKKVAELIGLSEKKKIAIKEAKFDQHIKEDIPDFIKARLSIGASIVFTFE